MHGNLLSCVNRIKHEDVNELSRFQPPGHLQPPPCGPVDADRLDGARLSLLCCRPDHHHLPTSHQYLVQHPSDSGEYGHCHRNNDLPVVLQRHCDVFGQHRSDDRMYGYGNFVQDLDRNRPMRCHRHMRAVDHHRRQYVSDPDLPPFPCHFL